jgi:hypothetical protein
VEYFAKTLKARAVLCHKQAEWLSDEEATKYYKTSELYPYVCYTIGEIVNFSETAKKYNQYKRTANCFTKFWVTFWQKFSQHISWRLIGMYTKAIGLD